MSTLVVSHLAVHYGAVGVLHDLSLSVGTGEVVTILGANGAGKTTLLETVLGINPAPPGSIVFDGVPIGGISADRIVRAGLCLVPEGRGVFAAMSVLDNLLLGARHNMRNVARNLKRVYGWFPTTIAFTVSYMDRSPEKAFQVANELMTLILSEDVRARTEGAATATEFFRQESRRLSDAIDDVENKIADFKAKNADALPENLDLHRQTVIRSQEELARVQGSITLAEEELASLQTQTSTYLSGAAGASGLAQEVLRLKTQLAALRADKTESHPDVRALRQQIASLERQLAPSGAVQKLRKDLAAADQQRGGRSGHRSPQEGSRAPCRRRPRTERSWRPRGSRRGPRWQRCRGSRDRGLRSCGSTSRG